MRELPTSLTLSVQVGVVTAPTKLILPSDARPAAGSAIAIMALVHRIHCLNTVIGGPFGLLLMATVFHKFCLFGIELAGRSSSNCDLITGAH
jgi:hypothetical protein